MVEVDMDLEMPAFYTMTGECQYSESKDMGRCQIMRDGRQYQ